jgi:hypothetical protein
MFSTLIDNFFTYVDVRFVESENCKHADTMVQLNLLKFANYVYFLYLH